MGRGPADMEHKAENRREMALRHVPEGRRIVFEQVRRLDVLKRDGHPTAMAD
jgi:hypothetical protein